jgi:ATP-binding cassette subfamily B protein
MSLNATKQDENTKRKSNIEIIRILISYLKPYKLKTFLVSIMMLFVIGVELLNPFMLKLAIDNYIAEKNILGLVWLSIGMLVVNLFAMWVSKMRMIKMGEISNDIVVNIRHDLYNHIQKLSFNFFDERPVGKILARIMGDINSLQQFFNSLVTSLIPEVITVVTVIIIMVSMNARLTGITMIVMPPLFLALFIIQIIGRKRWENFRKKRSNLNAYTHETFSGIKVVQSFTAEDFTKNNFRGYVGNMVGSFIHAARLQYKFGPLIELSYGLGLIAIYWYSFGLVGQNLITIGEIFAFTWYITKFWRPIWNIANFYNVLITSFAATDRIFEILDIKPVVENNKNGVKKLENINGEIEFENVSFSYDKDTQVLKNVDLKVKPGESIAFVGPTGAGKTTIVNLISRFYDPTEGKILLDGHDLKDLDLENLRTHMGIMLQDTFLFSTTIYENIQYGKLDATKSEVINAAKTVGLHDFIMSLKDGYDTEVNERGSRLSVGQRQLISLARALLADPKILILDEATSNIDTKTERLVQMGIEKLLENRTSFVIAHRLSTIRDVDRIVFIKDGRISEMGTHEELINMKNDYFDLYLSQFKFIKQGA